MKGNTDSVCIPSCMSTCFAARDKLQMEQCVAEFPRYKIMEEAATDPEIEQEFCKFILKS